MVDSRSYINSNDYERKKMTPEFVIQILTGLIGVIATGYAKGIHDNFKQTNKLLTEHLIDRTLHTQCGNHGGK